MRPTNAPSHPSTSPSSGRLARASADPAPLFVYGTLLFPDVLRVLLDRDPARTPVTVPGWRVVALPHVVYPTLIPAPATTATGHLLTDLTPHEWVVLDAFEDDRYQLTELTTHQAGTAYAYADSPEGHADAPDWDKTTFTTTNLNAYLDRCTAWRQRHDARQREGTARTGR